MDSANRMHWLDGARLAAAFFIIALHASADFHGQAFASSMPGERIFPVMMRTVSELASTEYFILVSLFLLAVTMSRRELPYADSIRQQVRRLLIPFLVWTVFYAFFRLYKAHYLGYSAEIWAELTQWQYWIYYVALGTSNYHMHFLPTLFALVLFYPIYRLATNTPVLALAVIPLIYLNSVFGDFIWRSFDSIMVIESWMRMAKILTYTGYGFVAYALYGVWLSGLTKETSRDLFKLALLAIVVGFLVKLTQAAEVIQTGNFGIRRGAVYMGHFLLPCFMILAFLASQHFRWPQYLARWSKYSFGMYLLHPAFLYLIEIAVYDLPLTATILVVSKFIYATTMSLCASVAISKIPSLAWTIGLGPIPYFDVRRSKSEVTRLQTSK